MPELSVIVCTHNPRQDYFDRALAGLRSQTLSQEKWELLIIDNCSREALAGRLDISWHSGARIEREEKLGLTPARLRGIVQAKADLLVFVDDDNVLDKEYLEEVIRIGRDRPFLGSWSGQCLPEFEEPPPEWSRRYWGNLCIRAFDKEVWSNIPRLGETMPAGAGLCVRRPTAQRYLRSHEEHAGKFQFDRTGDSLVSGGDNDLAACACDIGMGVGLIPTLKLTHLISRQRVTADYMERLAEGIHFSSTLLDAERGICVRPRSVAGRIIDFLRTLRLGQPHRRILRAAYGGRNRAARQLESAARQAAKGPTFS